MNTKRLIGLATVISLLVIGSFPVSATSITKGESWSYLWNAPDSESNYSLIGSSGSIITPMINMTVFDRYSPDSQIVDNKEKYVGQIRVDNSGNQYTSTTMIYQASSSGTFTASATVSGTTSAVVDAIVAKVEATVSISGTMSRSWTSGNTYGVSTTVPPKKIGTIKAYIPGTSSSGRAYYRVYNTSDSSYQTYSIPVGAVVPAKSAWNFVVTVS